MIQNQRFEIHSPQSTSTSTSTSTPVPPKLSRTPALIAQIDRLNQDPDVDYFVVKPGPRNGREGVFSFSLSRAPSGLRDAFHTIRKDAFGLDAATTPRAQRNAAAALCEAVLRLGLHASLSISRPPEENVLAQFEREFGPNVRGDVKLLDVVGFWECCYGAEYVFGVGEASSGKKGADGGERGDGENVEGEGKNVKRGKWLMRTGKTQVQKRAERGWAYALWDVEAVKARLVKEGRWEEMDMEFEEAKRTEDPRWDLWIDMS